MYIQTVVTTAILLCFSNIFMTFAWYGHLKNLSHRPWIVASLVSWGIAFFEYLIQVPANRIGHQVMNVGQLKILQEVVTLTIFVPFSLLYMKAQLRLDYLWAGLCILAAVFLYSARKYLACSSFYCRLRPASNSFKGCPERSRTAVGRVWPPAQVRGLIITMRVIL